MSIFIKVKNYALFALGMLFVFYVSQKVHQYNQFLKDESRLVYLEQQQGCVNKAARIVDYYYKQGIPVRFNVIKETLESIDKFLPVYFPNGPFTNKDFIAMAMIESDFNQYLVGTSGEKGIFQIMEESSKWMGVTKNQYDVDVNTELAMFVLNEKFKKFPDYHKAIIAYNGVVIRQKGWDQTYWKKFTKARTNVDVMFKSPIKS